MKRQLALLLLFALALGACAARQQSASPPQTDREITRVIWIAGSVSIEAKKLYQEGGIPQTEDAKTAINTLGLSYNEAKRVYATYLDAKAEYQLQLQLAGEGCAPGDQVCFDSAESEAAKREAAMAAAYSALVAVVADLQGHVSAVNRILGRG